MSINSFKIAYGSSQLLLKINGLEATCFILNNQKHVLPISSIQKLLGYDGKSETWLLNILNTISKFSKISNELLKAYENPIKIEVSNYKTPIETIGIIDSNAFIDTCRVIVEAKNNGLLGVNLIKVSKTAEIVLTRTQNQTIDDLIAVATGFSTFKENVKQSLQKHLQTQLEDNATQWLKTFPDDFYATIFEIHDLNWKVINSSPEVLGKILYEIVFCRISSELLTELRNNQPKRTYKRKDNRPQNIEHPELKKHIEQLMSLLKTSGNNWFIFMQLLNRTFPIMNHYKSKLRFDSSTSKKESLSSFNSNLKKLT